MTSTTTRRWPLLILHVATTVSVLGTDLALLVLGVSGARGVDPKAVYPAAHTLGEWLVAPLAILALVTGVLLAVSSDWGLAKYWWVTIKLAITAVLTVLVLVVVLPKLGSAADDATASRILTQSKKTLLEIIPIVASTLLLVNVILAVTKPRWRLGSGR